ncbi:MAG: methylenetetrahydrofolate reductase [Desulfobacterales bacterium]|nr:methylenetetrahydrofolate reductase [Desulfobacterales bacterium]
MNVARLYENNKAPVVSFEFFPPRDEKAEEKFDKVVTDLSRLESDYMSVTFGAGGSTKDGSYQAVKKLLEKKIPTVAYIAGYGLGPDEITSALDKYKALGIETIFVIRGDEPRDSAFTPHPESFSYAYEMIDFIKKNYDFTLGCAGYPEGHIRAESIEKDIEYLKLKVEKGAEYIVAQYSYGNNHYFEYVKKCRAAGITVPIIPGVMPIYTIKLTRMLAKVCGSSFPDELQQNLNKLAEADKDDVLAFGIEFAAEQCRALLAEGVPGIHFYTMDRSKSVSEVINRLRREEIL